MLHSPATAGAGEERDNPRGEAGTTLRGLTSMSKQRIQSQSAPAAIGPDSQALRAGDMVYLSGQIGLDPATGQMVEGVEAQTHRVMQNMKAVCEAAGGSLDHLVKVTLFPEKKGS